MLVGTDLVAGDTVLVMMSGGGPPVVMWFGSNPVVVHGGEPMCGVVLCDGSAGDTVLVCGGERVSVGSDPMVVHGGETMCGVCAALEE